MLGASTSWKRQVLSRPVMGLLYLFVNPLKAELNPFCHLMALLGDHHILHVSRVRVKSLKPLVKKKEHILVTLRQRMRNMFPRNNFASGTT